MKKAIVSGAQGFVGSAVVKELIARGVSVHALTHTNENRGKADTGLITSVPFELSSSEDVFEYIPIDDYDVFYHFAWAGSAGSGRCDTNLQLTNAQWTIDALNIAKKLGCKRFVCAGSIMENETIAAAYKDANRPGLAYIYGGGKVIAHIMAMSVAADSGIDLVWAKITNAYGPGESSPRMLNTTIRKILKREPLKFSSATQNYDFVYIDDVARAFYLIAEKGKPFTEYTIGSSSARPLKEFLLEMKEALSVEDELLFGDIPFTGINLPLSDFSGVKTEKETGFRAEIAFNEGVERTRNWIKEEMGDN